MRKIFLTINTDTADLRYNGTPQDIITNPADCPQIYAGEEVIFCCTFIGEDLQPVSFAETDTFDIGIDQNFDHSDDLMAYTNAFNAAGDWDEASPAAGKLSFRVSTATTGTVEKLANAASLQVKLEIRQFSTGSAMPSILCQAPAVMHNAVIGSAASTEEAEAFATAGQVNAAKSTADTALADAATAQSTADTALANAAAAQTAANSKLTAPVAAGTAGQVLTLDENGTTPVWSVPKGGLTKWGAWEDRSSDTTYTAGTNGWIRVNCELLQQGDNVSIRIDSDTVFALSAKSADLTDNFIFTFPVFAGQTYRISYPAGRGLAYFAPCV